MAFARNIRGHFNTICQTDTSDLAQRRIWLLGGHGTHDRTHAAFLRCAFILAHATLLVRIQCVLQGRGFAFCFLILAALADHLIDCRHDSPPITSFFYNDFTYFVARNEAITTILMASFVVPCLVAGVSPLYLFGNGD